MDIKKEYGTNKDLEIEGVWIDVGEGAKVKVARNGNKGYVKMIEKLSRPYKKQIRRGTISGEKFDKIIRQASARHILVNWEGIEEDGKEVPYSEEESYRLLTDYKDFREMIAEAALDFQNFQDGMLEEEEGNL